MKSTVRSSECKFSVIARKREDRESTVLLPKALGWVSDGKYVGFWYRGTYVGPLRILGSCDRLADLPSDSDSYGGAVYCREDKSIHLCIQDDLLA